MKRLGVVVVVVAVLLGTAASVQQANAYPPCYEWEAYCEWDAPQPYTWREKYFEYDFYMGNAWCQAAQEAGESWEQGCWGRFRDWQAFWYGANCGDYFVDHHSKEFTHKEFHFVMRAEGKSEGYLCSDVWWQWGPYADRYVSGAGAISVAIEWQGIGTWNWQTGHYWTDGGGDFFACKTSPHNWTTCKNVWIRIGAHRNGTTWVDWGQYP